MIEKNTGVARGLVPANLFEEYFQSHIRKKSIYLKTLKYLSKIPK